MTDETDPGRWYREALDRKWSDEKRSRQIRAVVALAVRTLLVLLVIAALLKWLVA